MSIEEDIKTRLDAHGGLSALVSARNHPIKLPQGVTYPAIAYRRISTDVQSTLGNLHLDNPRFSFDVIGSSYSSVRSVVTQLIAAMVNATTFTAVYLNDQDLDFDNGPGVYRTVVDFSVWQQ